MVELTIDGKKVSVPEGSFVMHAATELGLYVPHFCYHKKLSIAANCRMCLVEVEKAPKALPACATPVTQGMVVHTKSPKALAAQQAVMEFLLINHPLDCPICDQGGECQLQDLAVGYGYDASHYHEEKRVVFHKSMGPLISAEEMSRCIHCTRCVRFGQEVAGVMELGMLNRGEHAEITSFLGKAVSSELSGNMIDLCPVGALTSKPFRYQARTWELARRRSVSPHDSVGANLVVQVKNDRVLRVVPFENEAVNECWISDKDRFSYEGLYAEDRLTTPMLKGSDGVWREASWEEALLAAAELLQNVNEQQGVDSIGAFAAEYSTLEEMTLLSRIVRGLGSNNIDSRLRLGDENIDKALEGTPWLGMPIAELNHLDGVLVVDSNLRQDHPLFAQRLRQAAKAGARIVLLDSNGEDPLFPVAARLTVAPSQLCAAIDNIAKAVAQLKGGAELDEQDPINQIAAILLAGKKPAVFMGNGVLSKSSASNVLAHSHVLAEALAAPLGYLTRGANHVGASVAGATPQQNGMNAAQMMKNPLNAYVVLHAESLDFEDPIRAREIFSKAATIALTSYQSDAKQWAKIMLPVGPFTETSGTFINAEGRAQSFKGVVPSLGNSRPAWKVLRVLGNLLKLADFDAESSEAVRDAVLAQNYTGSFNNEVKAEPYNPNVALNAFERVANLPIYRSDAIVRRAPALQKQTAAPVAGLNAAMMANLAVVEGDQVRVKSNRGEVVLPVQLQAQLADNTVSVPLGFEQTAVLGGAFVQLSVEKV
ncbi:NADH-quinone oxidoreductase subunit NuoG [Oligella urethralis]|uniref:NADH-quinone oxidoreductase subunit NuoG n=1 Tax=Oligella urethralis TaxID=90245 RepID=UPI00254B910B|nr:NADH-quinone oxidoreductase subunit NuoG [Oligella urethralis]MDK6202707.1 NADH-quinone oxidoreductase subunit NuoG [Oligella urethralis]